MSESLAPKAYLRGFQDFYGRDFLVSPDVLIPRPETEQLIDMALSLSGKSYLPGVKASKRQISKNARILDVGTGSGCIAATLSLELPEAKVLATDISEKALAVAKENSKRLGAKVEFLSARDLISGLSLAEIEVIVANLPYVDSNWGWLDKEALAQEPEVALYAKDKGLFLYKKLFDEVSETDFSGYLIVEADPCQHKDLIEYASDCGFEHEKTSGFGLEFKSRRRKLAC